MSPKVTSAQRAALDEWQPNADAFTASVATRVFVSLTVGADADDVVEVAIADTLAAYEPRPDEPEYLSAGDLADGARAMYADIPGFLTETFQECEAPDVDDALTLSAWLVEALTEPATGHRVYVEDEGVATGTLGYLTRSESRRAFANKITNRHCFSPRVPSTTPGGRSLIEGWLGGYGTDVGDVNFYALGRVVVTATGPTNEYGETTATVRRIR